MSLEDEIKQMFELEQPCWNCYSSSSCNICNGTGYITTYFGDKVLEFLERHTDIKRKVR